MTKRAVKKKSKPHARSENYYKNQDKHRWRKVLVLLIPLPFAVFISLAFTDQRRVALWIVLCVVNVLGYAVFLLEWYVWKDAPARRKLRGVAIVLTLATFAAGAFYQRRITPNQAQLMSAVDMPYVSLAEIGMFDLEIGKTPSVVGVFRNSGKTPALKTTFSACAQPRGSNVPERPEPCESKLVAEPSAPTPVFMPSEGVYRMVLRLKGVVSKRDLELIGEGVSVIYAWGTVTYQDSVGEGYTLTYCAKYQPELKSFNFSPFDNDLKKTQPIPSY